MFALVVVAAARVASECVYMCVHFCLHMCYCLRKCTVLEYVGVYMDVYICFACEPLCGCVKALFLGFSGPLRSFTELCVLPSFTGLSVYNDWTTLPPEE